MPNNNRRSSKHRTKHQKQRLLVAQLGFNMSHAIGRTEPARYIRINGMRRGHVDNSVQDEGGSFNNDTRAWRWAARMKRAQQ